MKVFFSIFSRNRYLHWGVSAALAYLTVFAVDNYLTGTELLGRETILNVLLFGVLTYLYGHPISLKPYKKCCALTLAAMLAVEFSVGKLVYETNSVVMLFASGEFLFQVAVEFLGFLILYFDLASRFLHWMETNENNAGKEPSQWRIFQFRHRFWLIWGIIFLSWIPAIFAFYPGILAYDAPVQTKWVHQSISEGFLTGYSDFHPVLHTLIWEIANRIGRTVHIEPILLYTPFQMAILSFSFAMATEYLIDRKCRNSTVLLTLLFFSLNPVMAIMSGNMTKDVLFSAFFVMFTLHMLELQEDPAGFAASWRKIVSSSVCLLMVCLLRKNALMVGALMIPVVFFAFRPARMRVIPAWILTLFIFGCINWPLFSALGIKSDAPGEMLSIPLQQIARAVSLHDAEMTEDDADAVGRFMLFEGMKFRYEVRIADAIKCRLETEYYNTHKAEFWKLWLHYLRRYPIEYVDAFLAINAPYMYPDSCGQDPFSQCVYIEQRNTVGPSRDSKLPGLLTFYESVADYDAMRDLPVISNIFSMGTPLWLMIFSLFSLAAFRHYRDMIAILPALFYQLSFFLGPVNNFRYIFPIFCIYPLIVFLTFRREKRI